MGISFAWRYSDSFRRRCGSGQLGAPVAIRMLANKEEKVAAVDAQGKLLFWLEQDADGIFKMLDSHSRMAMITSPVSKDQIIFKDRTGRELAQLRRQCFTWEGRAFAWKAELLSFATLELREVGPEASKRTLATLRLQTDSSAGELTVAPVDTVPLGLVIFQALVLEHQWRSLRGLLAPLKKLQFSTGKWA